MATRDVFSDQELARLRGFPDITRAELIRYFTLTSGDEGFVGRFLGRGNVLGASVQLGIVAFPLDTLGGPSRPRSTSISVDYSSTQTHHDPRTSRKSLF